ncbi:hypothetical protein [Pseudomonas sp. Xaverov 259]|uniref:hypothetical protein n=1 Tax=Pseudomonas sp. Xaverov 259 TaxID=2666086 RepID=UPI001C5B7506|nr:hypothetical protein [Pseudomonas sp. Xaverov 259]
MEFCVSNYLEITNLCSNKVDVELHAEKSITVFANDEPPIAWKAFPPTLLSNKDYAQVLVGAGNDARGKLITLELLIHLDGGQVFYKALNDKYINLKIVWPSV